MLISCIDRARELAEIIGGEALSLADLSTYSPEEGMILANTTSIGMQPNIDETPISKVCLSTIFSSYVLIISTKSLIYVFGRKL